MVSGVAQYDDLFGGKGSAAKYLESCLTRANGNKQQAVKMFYAELVKRRNARGGKGSRAGGFTAQRAKRAKKKSPPMRGKPPMAAGGGMAY